MTRPISARLAVLAGLAMALAATEPAHARAVAGQHGAAPVTDCALRDAPFSAASPLVDILLSPNARAAAERGLGGSLDTLPALMTGTKAPTFAAILTLKEAAGFLQKSPEDVRRADAALRTIPVTAADRIARCTRYDNARLAFTLPKAGVHLLMFEKINGYRDGPSVDAAHGAFLALAKRKGWSITVTDKGGAFTPATLRRFDAVIWNNISGDVLTLAQRAVFKGWLEQGGAFVGVHGSAGDPAYFWDWYADGLIGARFAGHPMNPQFQDARVTIEDPAHPVAKGLPPAWVMMDEWYSFKTNPRAAGAHVIAALDESTYKQEGWPGQNLKMGEHPIAWTKCVGKGRMFYSAIGHRPETYTMPNVIRLIENGVSWAATAKHACPARN